MYEPHDSNHVALASMVAKQVHYHVILLSV